MQVEREGGRGRLFYFFTWFYLVHAWVLLATGKVLEVGSHTCEKSRLIADAHGTFVPLAHNDNSFTTFVWSYLQNSVRP